jgi:hypothetical protein
MLYLLAKSSIPLTFVKAPAGMGKMNLETFFAFEAHPRFPAVEKALADCFSWQSSIFPLFFFF